MAHKKPPGGEKRNYEVLVLPEREVAATRLSLNEARSFMQAYNEAMASPRRRAVIAESENEAKAA